MIGIVVSRERLDHVVVDNVTCSKMNLYKSCGFNSGLH